MNMNIEMNMEMQEMNIEYAALGDSGIGDIKARVEARSAFSEWFARSAVCGQKQRLIRPLSSMN